MRSQRVGHDWVTFTSLSYWDMREQNRVGMCLCWPVWPRGKLIPEVRDWYILIFLGGLLLTIQFSNLSCSPPLSQSCFSKILTGRLKKESDCNQVRGQGIELSWGEKQVGVGIWKCCMVPIAYMEWYKAHFGKKKKNQIFMEAKVTTIHSFALQYCIWETCLIKRHIYLCFLNVMLCNIIILYFIVTELYYFIIQWLAFST